MDKYMAQWMIDFELRYSICAMIYYALISQCEDIINASFKSCNWQYTLSGVRI
jgi:hypothetical protein